MLNGKLKTPLVTQIEVTENCNNLCMHCYNYWRYNGSNKFNHNEPDNLDEIVRKVIEADVFHIVFTGGEPLMKYDSFFSSLQIAISQNISCSLNSNLAFLNKERIQELKATGLGGILTSIYSADEETNNNEMNNPRALQNTLRGIEIALDADFSVSVNMVVTKNNVDHVYRTGDYLRSIGVQSFNASRFSPAVPDQVSWILGKEEIRSMLEQLQRLSDEDYRVGTLNPVPHCFASGKYVELTQRRGCSAGITSVGIGIDGGVRACQHADTAYGSVLEEPLNDIWQRIPIWKEEYLPDACDGCVSVHQCGGGCRHTANVLNGSYKAIDPLFSGKNTSAVQRDKSLAISEDSVLVLSENLRRRKESFGGVIFRDLQTFALVNQFIYDLLPSLVGRSFTVKEVASVVEAPQEKIVEYFSNLYRRKIIYESDGGENNG